MTDLTWLARIRIQLRGLVESKTRLLEQLRDLDPPASEITFDRYDGWITFSLDAPSHVEAYQKAARLVERLRTLFADITVTIQEFDVQSSSPARAPLRTFRIGFVNGSWVEVTADRYDQYGRGNPWVFRDDRNTVVATFPEHLVAAIVASDAVKDSSSESVEDAVRESEEPESNHS